LPTTLTAIITGAGSGVGRAVAIDLAKKGWNLSLFGRRREALEETRRLASGTADQIHIQVCDIGDSKSVRESVRQAIEVDFQDETLDALINCAGLTFPADRSPFYRTLTMPRFWGPI
jgi:NADP-dependent 3-hydroxy acid dehydrogenase YdfG